MSGPFYADFVKETTTTTGTGTISLAGAASGFYGFVAAIGTGNTCFYVIKHQSAAEEERGIGTVTDASPDTLSRDQVLGGTSGVGTKVNFSSGTKDVYVSPLASQANFNMAPVVPPPLTGWTWGNQGTATVSTADGRVAISDVGHSGTQNRWYYRTLPAAPYTITLGLQAVSLTSYFSAGVGWRDSGGKYVNLAIGGTSGSYLAGSIYVGKWDDHSTFNSLYRSKTGMSPAFNRFWAKLVDDNTNREVWLSYDRLAWTRFHQVSRTNFLTANAVSLFLNSRDDEGATGEVGGSVSLFDYQEG